MMNLKKLWFSSTFPKMLLIAWKLGPKSSVLKLSVGALQVSMTGSFVIDHILALVCSV